MAQPEESTPRETPRAPGPDGPPVIDPDELCDAQTDERINVLLKDAELEGQRIEREGRRRW